MRGAGRELRPRTGAPARNPVIEEAMRCTVLLLLLLQTQERVSDGPVMAVCGVGPMALGWIVVHAARAGLELA